MMVSIEMSGASFALLKLAGISGFAQTALLQFEILSNALRAIIWPRKP